jgi:DNA-binding HxlR family transcriptional regulator
MNITSHNPRRPAPPENCPLEVCLKFLSSAWTIRILWFLDSGPRRFGDLRRDLVKISTKVLTERLRTLETQGLISRTTLPTSPAQVEYDLTVLGREFNPILTAMLEVAKKISTA